MTTERRIEELESSLNTSDWVITRIHEAQLLGEDITPLMEKYREVISQRQLWRDELDSLKEREDEQEGQLEEDTEDTEERPTPV